MNTIRAICLVAVLLLWLLVLFVVQNEIVHPTTLSGCHSELKYCKTHFNTLWTMLGFCLFILDPFITAPLHMLIILLTFFPAHGRKGKDFLVYKYIDNKILHKMHVLIIISYITLFLIVRSRSGNGFLVVVLSWILMLTALLYFLESKYTLWVESLFFTVLIISIIIENKNYSSSSHSSSSHSSSSHSSSSHSSSSHSSSLV